MKEPVYGILWGLGQAGGGGRNPVAKSGSLCPVSGGCVRYAVVMSDEYRWANPMRDAVVQRLLSVSDEDMAEQQPYLRALVLQRLEVLWRTCEPHMEGGDAYPKDVRYAMLGERVLKQLAAYGRLDTWSSVPRGLDVGADERVRAIEGVDRGLRELEGKQ